MRKVKIGIVGCGGIANQKHLPSLKACSEKNEIIVKPEQAFVVTQILEAIYKSAETGEMIK